MRQGKIFCVLSSEFAPWMSSPLRHWRKWNCRAVAAAVAFSSLSGFSCSQNSRSWNQLEILYNHQCCPNTTVRLKITFRLCISSIWRHLCIDLIILSTVSERFSIFTWRVLEFQITMSLAAARPLISVYTEKSEPGGVTVCLPAVFRFVCLSWMDVEMNSNRLFDPICTFIATYFIHRAPVRPDIVSMIHNEVAKNRRQPYCVSKPAGHQVDSSKCALF